MKSAEALLIIDYTNDFVADQGSLTTAKPGQEIQSQIIKLANEFKQKGNFIIFPTDLHDLNDPYHPETKLFPPHNLAETWGHELYDQVQQWYQKNQNSSQVYYYNKNRYSAFVNSNLDNFLRSRHIKKLTLVGVYTDICILHTAVSAYNLNYQLRIPASAVASFDPAGHKWALNHFKTCLGAEII